ncbi:DUF2798 domain-containing protein [Reyranella soli]|uniref:DUF2798 domain-containing protein n=1 Tax=Reyranella soli TaxID=1230389 RepID=A0A512N513_9HYPH|nr:DUF2798 domain-containing protein [Reyranella soli]GEP54066.1 hypothetical protein RSO01_12320 [Reyranella soli]
MKSFPARKLPARYAGVVVPLVLSLFMMFVVSGIATARSLGFSQTFPSTWLAAWGLSWVIAFPTLLLVMPLVKRVVALIVEPPGR